jgi:TolB-like protein/Flp pilus assembly protein TadD
MSNLRSLVAELRRRNVIRMAGLYLVGAWLVTQVAGTVLPMFGAPEWLPRSIVIVLAIGFIPALVFAWVFELTPEGIKRDAEVKAEESIAPQTARRMDRMILVGLALIIVLMGVERVWFAARTSHPPAVPASTEQVAGTSTSAGAATPAAASANAIAVMAFADLSPAHDQGYFSDGMAEEILNALTRIRGLRVLGRSSSFQYKGKDVDPRRIGTELGVAHILDGSVRRQGDLVRIAATLISTVDGAAQWTKEYNGKLADLFDLQDNCAHDIAAELKIVLAGGQRPLVDKVTANPEAYALYVEAQTLIGRRVGESLPHAIEKLDHAVQLDPSFARAWSRRAVAYAVLAQYVSGDWRANWDASEESVRRALAIDQNDAEAYAVRSYNLFSQRRYVEMVEPMRRALEIDPGNETARYWHINELAAMGQSRKTLVLLQDMAANDPDNARVLFYLGFMKWREGDLEGLRTLGQRALALGSPFGDIALASYDMATGACDDGVGHFLARSRAFASTLTPAEAETVYRGMCGGTDEHAAATKLLAARPDQWAATLWLELGEPERAFDAFEHGAAGISDGYLNWLWQPDGWSKKARRHQAFAAFARHIGLVDYWKKYGWPDLCRPQPQTSPDAFVCD